jgi:glycosyltransferase involved in cell wall biosynthesis
MPGKRISVVVPLFNNADLLGDCLASIAAETYGHLQVIMVDDGSTDGSAAVARKRRASLADQAARRIAPDRPVAGAIGPTPPLHGPIVLSMTAPRRFRKEGGGATMWVPAGRNGGYGQPEAPAGGRSCSPAWGVRRVVLPGWGVVAGRRCEGRG